MALYRGMLEDLVAIVEVLEVPKLLTDAAIWVDDLFLLQQHEKHLEKPSLKDLKNSHS